MRAFVLAAGLGVRMGALGEAHPKALLPLGGVPVVRFALERLRRAGVGEATVNLHHRAEALRAERDRLVAELAATRAERDALTDRVGVLQRSLSAPLRPGLAERALSRALATAARARARAPREYSLR